MFIVCNHVSSFLPRQNERTGLYRLLCYHLFHASGAQTWCHGGLFFSVFFLPQWSRFVVLGRKCQWFGFSSVTTAKWSTYGPCGSYYWYDEIRMVFQCLWSDFCLILPLEHLTERTWNRTRFFLVLGFFVLFCFFSFFTLMANLLSRFWCV